MFLFPALTIGFLFVGVPLLVHLINMLRHRRLQWAAMDFLMQSYRKQRKWIRLRQFLLLLSRLALATLLIAMLCGWTGGGRALQMLGGTTTHHVVILDDSYSMGDTSLSGGMPMIASGLPATAYGRSLGALQDLIRRLAADDGNHQLTVMRSSRAAMAMRGGSDSGDAAADLSAQTVTSDGRIADRLMSTTVSPVRTDLSAALDLAADLVNNTPADSTFVYVASDFRKRDWESAERLAASMRRLPRAVSIHMIDCAADPAVNLAITDLSPVQDVWVAGVPVVVDVTVKNYASVPVQNIAIESRVIRYGERVGAVDATARVSGEVESLPAIIIESLAAGEQVTKSFQVFITETGTHAIEVSLPDDALAIDNSRVCTLPLSDAEKVLVIDGDVNTRGAYHVASVLNPGSQVRIGAVPDLKPPAFLRSASWESLAPYRAIYLINLPEITDTAADALQTYVHRGGGVAWFLGDQVRSDRYNETLLAPGRQLLPAPLGKALEMPMDNSAGSSTGNHDTPDLRLGESANVLLAPLASWGEAALSLVGISKSWQLELELKIDMGNTTDTAPRLRRVIDRRDGLPWVLQHDVGRGRVITVLSGLDGAWTNWPGDPSFVVFMLQANAMLWSGAAPPTGRFIDEKRGQVLPQQQFTGDVVYVPSADQPPRVAIDVRAQLEESPGGSLADAPVFRIEIDPQEMVIEGQGNMEQWLRPGIAEWGLTAIDGSSTILPEAVVIRVGEGDLRRADQADMAQQLLPTEVKFMTSSVWSDQNQSAGSSALTLFLLGLLGAVLAAEQTLAYWASYHVRGQA